MSWRRVTLPLPATSSGYRPPRDLVPPPWSRRELTGQEAATEYGFYPVLALQEAVVTGADGVPRFVALVPDVPVTNVDVDRGAAVVARAHAVLWGPADGDQSPDGGRLHRTLEAARRFYEQLTKGRTTEEVAG